MRKILRSQSEKAPQSGIDGFQRELMCQIAVFVSESRKIAFGKGILTVSLRHRGYIEQSCLPHEHRLDLEDVVAVVRHIVEGYVLAPRFSAAPLMPNP